MKYEILRDYILKKINKECYLSKEDVLLLIEVLDNLKEGERHD